MVSITIYIRVSQSVVHGTTYIRLTGKGGVKIQVLWPYPSPTQSTL